MRLFVAAELNRSMCDAVWIDAAPLRAAAAPCKWVRPDLMHLTLKFIGEIEDGRTPSLARATRESLAGVHAIPCRVGGLGAFPSLRRPRVIWVGIDDGGALSALARQIDAAFVPLGVPADSRPFAAHLTLGRVKDEFPQSDADVLRAAAERIGTTHDTIIDRISLVRSTLGAGGPRYETQQTVTLDNGVV